MATFEPSKRGRSGCGIKGRQLAWRSALPGAVAALRTSRQGKTGSVRAFTGILTQDLFSKEIRVKPESLGAATKSEILGALGHNLSQVKRETITSRAKKIGIGSPPPVFAACQVSGNGRFWLLICKQAPIFQTEDQTKATGRTDKTGVGWV